MTAVLVFVAASIHAQDATTSKLLDAAKKGELAVVRSLLEQGASPNVKDAQGRTPLHWAAANAHRQTAGALLDRGAEINAPDTASLTPLDLAESGGHSGMAEFLRSRGAVGKQAGAGEASSGRALKPSLKFKTLAEFEAEIREPAVMLDSENVVFFAPKRREKEARIILGYLIKAYDALRDITGTDTNYKMVIYAFPKGNPNGWGGTSDSSIEYDDTNLALENQEEWKKHKIPHVSGYIEEMSHNFVHATKAQFGWEMIGWSIGAEVSQRVAGNPTLTASIQSTRKGQEQTFNEYFKNGCVLPRDLPYNQCDRIHAWILYQCQARYGANFWKDFFREARSRKKELVDAVSAGDTDAIRNARYQITVECFDKLPGLGFKKILSNCGVSLTTDVKSLHPEAPGWDRRLTATGDRAAALR